MSTHDHADRRRRLIKLMKEKGLKALLVTNPVNVSYLTGFTGDDSYFLLTAKEGVVISDARFEEDLAVECPDLTIDIRRPPIKMLDQTAKVMASCQCKSVGFEGHSLSWELAGSLMSAMPECRFEPAGGLVESLREIKEKSEITAIRSAIEAAERAFGVVRAAMRKSQTEKEIGDEIDHQIRLFGGICSSFPAIVGVGPRAALPHGRPSEKRIEESDFVLIDWGARRNGYISDLTRVLTTGKISPKLERLYGVVLKAQLAAIEAIRPGALLQEVDAAARNVIADAGYGKQFGHSLGHGIGLQVHEAPRVAMEQTAPLKVGMVITVEPGIYFPGWGGIRIEDDILVTKEGHEVLTSVPKGFEESIVAC